MYARRQVTLMSMHRDPRTDDSGNDQDASIPRLRSWWSELSPAAKVLIPTAATVFVFVTATALPPLVF
jgi:hypothetical protein